MSSKLLVTLSMIGSFLLVGCTPTATTETPDSATTETPAEVDDTAMMQVEEESEEADMETAVDYEIEMSNFAYSMEEITVEPGDSITVKLINAGGHHDFDIDELEIDTEPIAEGEDMTVTIDIPEDAEPGTEYAYYCSVGSHRAQGMEGKIVVE